MAIIFGNNNNNSLSGTTVSDIMFARAGNDQLFGLGGNDRLNGGLGNDLLNGGTGIDTADYSNGILNGQAYIGAAAGVTANLNLVGAQDTGGAGIDTLVSIENLIGTNFNDTFTGNAGANVLEGGAGNDTIDGGTGNDLVDGGSGNDGLEGDDGHDTIIGGEGNDDLEGNAGNDIVNGGAGNDRLEGASGNDTLNGGNGTDTVRYETATGSVTVSLAVTTAQATGGNGSDTLINIENLIGSDFFNDTLTGNSGNNVLSGGGGNDTLIGGAGTDTLNGDVGNDLFDYNAVAESPVGASRDKINGFSGNGALAGDRIDLTTIDANVLLFGNQAFSWIGGNSFTAAGQLRYSGGILSGSTDGDTAAEFEIQLAGVPALVVGGAGTDILL